MPYTVLIEGVSVQCDTAEEALQFAQLHIGPGAGGRRETRISLDNGGTPGSRWTAQRIKEFFNFINASQRKFIDALLEAPDGLTEDQILPVVGVKNSMALAGVTSALQKNAKKVGADPRDVYERKPVTIGDKQTYEYLLKEAFRRAAKNK